MPKTLLIHVPLSWDRVHRAFFKSFVEITAPHIHQEMLEKYDCSIKYYIDESFPLDYNRNKAAEAMLYFGAEWLLCLDADQVLPRRTIPMLMERWTPEYPVVTGNYHKKAPPCQSVVGWYMPNHHLGAEQLYECINMGFWDSPSQQQTLVYRSYIDGGSERPIPVDVSGMGCILIHRSAFEKIKKPYFKYFDEYQNNCKALGNITEDMQFFSQMKKAGVKMRLDPRIQCGHLSEKEITFMDFDAGSIAMATPKAVPV